MNSCCSSSLALLGLLLITACADSNPPAAPVAGLCQSDVTPITVVQGDGYYSPSADSLVTVRGIVTFVAEGKGFYLEDIAEPASPSASRALFVSADQPTLGVQAGQQLTLSGLVSEQGAARDKLTSLINVSEHQVCADPIELPLTKAALPMNSQAREKLEGMRVFFAQELTITDVYKLSGGELSLSSNGVLRVPTEVVTPGETAEKLARENRNHTVVAVLPTPGDAAPTGSTMKKVTGIMGHNGRVQQLWLDAQPELAFPSLSSLAPPVPGGVRIVSSNLLNFFNGDGNGGGFPTERGAETPGEFEVQSARLKAAMTRIQPDLLAVQELENDGFGPDSAAQSLLAILNKTGNDDWAFVQPGTEKIGGDVITVGLFYRRQVLETIGPAVTLGSSEFQHLSRQPLAQLFRDRKSGQTFLAAVNHLKSKGGCPDNGENADQDDGQGCWNPARLSAVLAEVPWLEGLALKGDTDHIIILGDMNSWRREDPTRQFGIAGYIDLVEQLSGLPQHSFLYWGQTGTLDYAFASPAMAAFAQRATIWHINADWPRKMTQPEPWLRTSDHDPVIVDFSFSHSATSN